MVLILKTKKAFTLKSASLSQSDVSRKLGFTLKSALLARFHRVKLPDINAQPKNGFTLIELVVSIAIVGVISIIIATILIRYTSFYKRQQAEVAANSDNRAILDDIANDVRQSESVVNSVIVSGQTYTTSTNTLVVRMTSYDQTGNPLSNIYDYLIYYQDTSDTKVFKKTISPDAQSFRPASFQILTSNLNSIAFSYNNADPQLASVVTVNLQTIKTESGETKIAQDTIQIKLRGQ